jgi:carboxylesterase type B
MHSIAIIKVTKKLALLLTFAHLLISWRDTTSAAAPPTASLLYNTSSGVFEARLVRVSGLGGFNPPRYIHKLLSVPYAEQPERFRHSVTRVYRAQPPVHRPLEPIVCHQPVNLSSYGLFNLAEPPAMIEDCLTVNLYIPVASEEADETERYKPMPLVIHIHGGSNMVGGAALFDGSILASYGRVIVAIINYRLSVLGFLTDTTSKYPGNYGLHDQVLALK